MVSSAHDKLQLEGQRRSSVPRALPAIVSAQPRRACPAGHRFDSPPAMVQPPEVSSLVQRNKVVAKRKGTLAAATVVGAGVVGVAVSPILGVVAFAGAAYLAWDWFSFRVKNGMRF
jgi:hypothetical protein